MSHALVICTANVCRSPVTAALLAGTLGSETEVKSAGTRAYLQEKRCPMAAEWLREWVSREDSNGRVSADGAKGIPTQLDADLVRGAGIILTASREHRSAVVRLVPRAQQVTFTIRQAARLAAWGLVDSNPRSLRRPR